jgi:hypothetical protein
MLGLLTAAGTLTASAASVTFVGKANDTTGGNTASAQANFRSTDVPKAYDIDNNEVYGTDGYKFWATSAGTLTSLPAYITSITPVGTSGNGVGQWNAGGPGFGPMDDPSQPPGAGVGNLNAGVLFKKFDNTVAPYAQGLVSIVLAADATFRIGIVQISGDRQKGQQLILGDVAVDTLPPGDGGTPAGTGTAVNNYDRFDIYLFDVTGTAGETVTLQGLNAINGALGGDQLGICGFTFDSNTVVSAPELDITRSAAPVPDGGTDPVSGTVPGVATPLTYTLTNSGTAALSVTTLVTIGGLQTNCTATVTTQPSEEIAPMATSDLVVSVTPTVVGAWSFTVAVANTDPNEHPYNWTVSGTASSATAATVTFVGKANDTTSANTASAQGNFRSTDVAKAFDVDGNDVYGTDGYKFWATSAGTLTSLPSYITSITPVGTSGNGVGQWNAAGPGFGPMDDPSLPPGAGVANINSGVLFKRYDATVAPYVQDLVSIVLAADATFRIGIVQISGDRQKGQRLILGGTAVDTLPPSEGGMPAGTGTAVNNYDRFDIYLFDVTGTAGETIVLQGLNAIVAELGAGQLGICGFTFDSNTIVAGPELDLTRSAAAVADGGTDAVSGTLVATETTLTYTLANSGTAALSVTSPVTIGALQTNCTATVTTQPGTEVAATGASNLVVSVTPTAVGSWSFTVSVENTDPNENPYNWTVSGTASSASPATVTFVGKANSTLGGDAASAQANFRSTDVTKAFDSDNNDVYGSDGYKFWNTSNISQEPAGPTKGTLTQLPSYITSITPVGTNGNGTGQWNAAGPGFGRMDDPTLPPGAGVANLDAGVLFKKFDSAVAPYIQDLASIVLASNATFRIGIVQISGDRQKGQRLILGGTAVDTLPPGEGGVPAGTGTAVNNYDRFDIYLFDVTGTAGETIVLQGLNATIGGLGEGQLGITGFTFDSNTIVPSAYDTWAQTHITAIDPLANATPAGDPDHDGATSLAEFAFNGNPVSGANQGQVYFLTADSDADPETDLKELILTIAVLAGTEAFSTAASPVAVNVADGITYMIEGSTTLSGFLTPVVPVAPITTGLPGAGTGYEYRSFSLVGSNGLPGTGFLRAKVTQP